MLWWKIIRCGNGGFIFMIMNNKCKKKLKQITKHIKFLNPKWIIMDQLYSKSNKIVLVTFLSDSIIEKCIENLEMNVK